MSRSLLTLLRTLAARDVEFLVVGGMAGVLQGAPITTTDLDIVHNRSPENVARLLSTLRDLQAVYRADPRQLQPTEAHLAGQGHLLLTTSHGPLDVLGEVSDQGYEDLANHVHTLDIGEGRTVRVVTLDKLIELKERAGRPKDLQALAILRATLAESQRSE